MQAKSQRPKGRDAIISTLNFTIEAMNLTKEICSITPANSAFGSVSLILTMIEVCFPPSRVHGLPVHLLQGIDD